MDVVVPFRGAPAHLEELRARLARLRLRPGDSLLVVDNTPGREPATGPAEGTVPVLRASELSTPGYARNRGVSRGRAEWLVFFDADTVPSPGLLDRYFEPAPAESTALMAGGVVDEAVPADGQAAARYAYLRRATIQDDTLRFGKYGYPKTANAACRRAAFEAVGGFREDIRAGEDADLTYRLRAEGWEVERREHAGVVHRNRTTVRGWLAQKALHGAGGGWLAREYPGTFLPRRRAGLVWWGVRLSARRLLVAARTRDRDEALWAIFEPLEFIVWEFGRSLPNERPLSTRAPLMRLLEKAS